MKLDATRLPELLDDLDAAVREARAAFAVETAEWTRGPAGKWTAGQHMAHVGVVLLHTAGDFENAAAEMAAGRLGPRPWRDPLQALAIRFLTRERFPRGGRTPPIAEPGPTPSREQAFARIEQGAARHRALAERLSPDERRRIWIWNPVVPQLRWHYTLPEMVRVHASHTRHHVRLAQEAARS